MSPLSNSQIDKLGMRLKAGEFVESDLRQLDDYRRSFGEVSAQVLSQIHTRLDMETTARPAKSSTAIVEKLHRESCRLSQIQDIAGCRLLVATVAQQDDVRSRLVEIFPAARVEDRRQISSHGYRAVHMIVKHNGRLMEIQIRTELQHCWAVWSEKVADAHGHELKYGQGPEAIRSLLENLSRVVQDYEESEEFHRRYPQPDIRKLRDERHKLAALFESLMRRLPSRRHTP
jgi:putative GTP pyrophosphokinase